MNLKDIQIVLLSQYHSQRVHIMGEKVIIFFVLSFPCQSLEFDIIALNCIIVIIIELIISLLSLL
jgi:hypothetical protein